MYDKKHHVTEKKSSYRRLFLFPADEDHGEGERHLQRGEADGGGRAVAGLSAAGVLQPGDQHAGRVRKRLRGPNMNM